MMGRINFSIYFWLIIILCSISGVTYAQTIQSISGVAMEKGTNNRLADVNVTNLRTQSRGISNNFGVFSLEASVGDSLSFTKVGYGTVKTVLYSMQDFVIELQAGIKLETVTIDRLSREAELNALMNDYSKKGIYNNGSNKFGTYIASPATALYNLFGQEAKNARRFSRMMDREKDEIRVDRVFNRTVVVKYTGLEGDQLQSFMDIYRPTFHMVEYWGEYDLINYIKSSFEQFEANGRPKSDRLPKIEIPNQEK